MNAGIIVAAGQGTRYGSHKQVEPLLDKKVYQYALEAFLGSELIDIVYLVVNEDLYDIIQKDLNQYNASKSIILCEGGDTRLKSVYNAISIIRTDQRYKKVCISDAVRPLITKEDIENVILSCNDHTEEKDGIYTHGHPPDRFGCVVGKKIYDTVKRVDGDNFSYDESSLIVETIDRSQLWISQTPQAFCLKTLWSCYTSDFHRYDENIGTDEIPFTGKFKPEEHDSKTLNDILSPERPITDEAGLLEFNGYNVKIIESKNINIKITNEEDLELVQQFLSKPLTGLGIDFHSLDKGDGLVIGGYKIKCNLKSVAHSDGDVLTHAIIDALCGALNLGDIGEHFPNTANNKNISSIKLLEKIVSMVPSNINIVNIDASIVLNEPKISKYKSKITSSLASALKISKNQISIKGTTTNRLNFIDMKNGWGAEVIITLQKWN